jgi:hypothetical protein
LFGNDWKKIFSANITNEYFNLCHENNITITAKNWGDCSATNPAGVLYALVQNTKDCY